LLPFNQLFQKLILIDRLMHCVKEHDALIANPKFYWLQIMQCFLQLVHEALEPFGAAQHLCAH